MPNINLKYPFFGEYDTEKKLSALFTEADMETNNGTKKEDLTNLVKFAAEHIHYLRAERAVFEANTKKEIFNLDTRLEWSNRALSDIEDWCVEFHETGPHDPDKALKIVMQIYEIAHERLKEEGLSE